MSNTDASNNARHPRRMARPPQGAPARSRVAPAATSIPPLDAVPSSGRPTKIDVVLKLLRRPSGATLPEMVDATGWLPHTTRAALTGLRKKGHVIEKSKRDDVICYRVVEAK